MQGVAEPNSVVIAEGTRSLLGNLFDLEDLGSQELKGIAGVVRAWTALRPASVESRFEALHASDVTELVGREEELEMLLRRWSKAKGGEGQVVLLSGEPGIGKSRLSAALLERIASEPHMRLRYFCSPQRTDSALFPIISQMERAARFAHNDTVQVKLEKFDALLTQSSTPHQDAALLSELLSLPNDGRYPALELTPEQRRQKTLEALHAQVETFARKSPVLMIFEDVHWADPTSLELFGRGVNRIVNLPVLLLITFRPELNVTALTLNRLTRREVDAMIDRVAGNKSMPANIRQEIIERTDGIPLFVEEMTKLEAEGQSAPERTAAAIPSSALAVPATLHASLMARLDRLGGPAKEVAQIGAAIGREFSHALLAAVAGKPEEGLEAALARLVAAGLLFRLGVPPHATYLFKHALVQDAAYGTLLREPRRGLHARIAETLESQFAEIAENEPELLARHCTEARLIEKAAHLWGKAGQRSLERSALVEGAEQLTCARTQLATLPATPALRREQIKVHVALINPLMHVKGYAAPETRETIERARDLIKQAEALGEPPEDPLLLFSILYSFWVANFVAFNGDAVRELAAQFLALAEEQGTSTPLLIAHRLMGLSQLMKGDLVEARTHQNRAIALYDPTGHRPLVTRFGVDAGATVLCQRSWTLWCLGYPRAALADADRAVRDARGIGHIPTLMHALVYASFTLIQCGDYAAANAELDEVVTVADEKGVVFWLGWARMEQGRLFAMTGRAAEAIQLISSVRTARTEALVYDPVWLSLLARAYATSVSSMMLGATLARRMTWIKTRKETWWEAEVNRVAGEIALLSPNHDAAKARTYFERALTIAHQQQAKSWELRAAMSLARLWRDQGKPQQARNCSLRCTAGSLKGSTRAI